MCCSMQSSLRCNPASPHWIIHLRHGGKCPLVHFLHLSLHWCQIFNFLCLHISKCTWRKLLNNFVDFDTVTLCSIYSNTLFKSVMGILIINISVRKKTCCFIFHRQYPSKVWIFFLYFMHCKTKIKLLQLKKIKHVKLT